MSLETKCGPTAAPELSVETAVAQIAAYERMLRVIAAGLGDEPRAPAFHLSQEQLTGLFAPRALDVLISKPFGPKFE